jgi:hypothetical protein
MKIYKTINPWDRVRYFVEQGLVERAPTPAQLAHAEAQVGMTAGPLQRLASYARRPLSALSSRGNAEVAATRTERDLQGGVAEGMDAMPAPSAGQTPLEKVFLLPPVRFATNFAISPYYIRPGSGLDTPIEPLVHHLLSQPHTTATWDVQLLQASPGGMDRLRTLLAEFKAGHGVRWQLYRLLTQRPTYFAYLEQLIEECERFDYPVTPAGFQPQFENLVLYLRYAATLDDQGRPMAPLPVWDREAERARRADHLAGRAQVEAA